MFSKKNPLEPALEAEESPSSPAPAKKASEPGRPFDSYLTLLYLLLSGLFAAAWFVSFILVEFKLANHEEDRTRVITQITADRIAERLDTQKRTLRLLAKDPSVATLLASNQGEMLKTHIEWTLRPQAEEAQKILVLPKGYDVPDLKATPPLGYASLDLFRQIDRNGKETQFELHNPASQDSHIAVAFPVSDAGGGLLGYMYFALRHDWLARIIKEIPAATAVGLLQTVPRDKPVRVVSNNEQASLVVNERKAVPVPGSIWLIDAQGLNTGPAWLDLAFWLLLPLILAAGAAMLLFIKKSLSKNIQQDRRDFQHTLVALFSGRRPPPAQARIRELHGATQLLLTVAKKTAISVKGGSKQEKTAQPKTGPEPRAFRGEDALPAEAAPEVMPVPSPKRVQLENAISPTIFRAYDIRGIVGKTLTEETVYDIGKAIGSEAYEKGQQTVIVARDGRTSSEALLDALARGLTSTGRDVVDIGLAPTPLLYFATHFLGSNTGIMVTGSHNPPEYNGLKIVINGISLHGQALKALHERAVEGRFLIGNGSRLEQSLIPDYIQRVCNNLTLQRSLRVVVDCGNGVAGRVAPDLLRALGCDVKELFTQVDGTFPNHHPDPSKPENLTDLIDAVRLEGADLGVAYDGDGDRIGIIDSNGKIIWPDRLLMLLADDILARNPGADVIYDIKSSRHIAPRVLNMGGRPVLWKTGHSLVKAKMRETGALLGGEMTGHIFIKERWYGFDDALYATARLLEILAIDSRPSAAIFAELPEDVSTPEIHLEVSEGSQAAIMKKIIDAATFDDANLITLDGLRVEFPEGWGLVRASNTTPNLTFRFEAVDAASLERIQEQFRDLLRKAVPGLQPPF